MNKISIITINFNNLNGLIKTVESVLNQTNKDYEYIIIDGGSTDGSKEYIESKSVHFDLWVSEPDKGIFNAMNKGIEKATGDYLLFLNSGDCLNGNNILNEFLNHNDFQGDIIYGDLKFEKGRMKFPNQLTPFFFVISSLPHQATLFKREVFESMGLYDELLKISSDRSFYIKCFLSNQFHFQYLPIELTLFDQKGISNDKAYNELKRQEKHQILKQHFGIYYEDYIKMEEQKIEITKMKLNSTLGFIKRIKNKLKKMFNQY